MLTLPDYEIINQIYESVNSLVYRGFQKKDNQPIILKMLKEDYPSPAELTRYQQEFEMTQDLDLAGVIKTYCIEKYQNTRIIILEDFGGESLKHSITNQSMTIQAFLALAIQIADSLGHIHAHNIIHKDINPTNIIVNQNTQELKIIDFGIASRLPRENTGIRSPEQLEGTLAYLSPEQTGRINRSIDYRSDLYSLGVTFYELLTGFVPFSTTDAIELVHCHLAKNPPPVSEINPDLPVIISDIVMKLMAKNAEDRYQSAFGVKSDLEQCQLQLTKSTQITAFKLAQNDFSGQFQIPQKLYGREEEIKTLLQAFERVTEVPYSQADENHSIVTTEKLSSLDKQGNGRAEMILVAGYSGVGKSALVYELQKYISEKRGYFLSGKFDQYQRNIPYSALTQAFNGFCDYLLTESDKALHIWRETIQTAVAPNGQVLIEVIPSLALVIGEQPAIIDVGPSESQNRFNFVCQNFMQAICQPEHPLVLFIDDWQWADSASVTLLKNLITELDSQAFLMIAAFRDNEVDDSHPFMMAVQDIKKAAITVNQIDLSNLSAHHVNLLISKTLRCQATDTQVLTDLIYQKTQGNPFFTLEFLKSLYEEGLLVFDLKNQQWEWDIDKIADKGLTDNVVELMANKINKLSAQTQTVLTLGACIGNSFDLKTLSIIAEQQPLDILSALLSSLKEGLLLPLDEAYKFVENISLGEINPRFKFQHDRVQQAAYSLIAESDKQAIHLKIGRLLLAGTSEVELEDSLFDIVNQFNKGIPLIDIEAEKQQLAKLNLRAGQKAKEASAYASASEYLIIGIDILGEERWQQHYSLTFSLYKAQIEASFLNSHFEESEKRVHRALAQVKSPLEKSELYYLLISQYIHIGQYEQAIPIGRKALALLGIHCPEAEKDLQAALEFELSELKKNLAGKETRSLLLKTEINDPIPRLIINLLWKLMEASFGIGSETLLSFVCAKVAKVGIDYHVPESCLSYCGYSYLLTFYGEYESAYEFGLVAFELTNQFNNLAHKCIVCEGIADALIYWLKPLKSVDVFFNTGYQAGLDSGTFSFTGYLACHYSLFMFYRGDNLEETLERVSQFLPFAKKTQHDVLMNILSVLTLVLWNLNGRTLKKEDFHNDALNETQFLANTDEEEGIPLCFFHLLKSQVLYLYNKPDEAYQSSLEVEKLLPYLAGMYFATEHNFYYSLNLAALYPTVSKEEQEQYWAQLEINQKQMKNWAKNCPENFLHKYLLVKAEMARLSAQLEAIDLYDQAITSARENEFIQNEALANELAARFWLIKGKKDFAQIYLKKAHYGYQLWGAKHKTQHLKESYPQFFEEKMSLPIQIEITPTSVTQVASSNCLDLDSVMKAAQTLSGEIVLSRLLERMMHILIENAGASIGFLLLPQKEQWVIEAEGHLNRNEVKLLQSLPLENQPIAESLIQYVARTQENVVLNNASREGQFTRDPYIVKQRPQSVLCAPLLNQSEVIGILYLENNLMEGAFTGERLQILTVLSSQIAISIENALLYRTLEEKVDDRTALLAQRTEQLGKANQEITALNEQLKSENLRMSAELNVSRQLQQMLLPKEQEFESIEALEIAGFMAPADEVGGDYYDVLQHAGRVLFGIGDVTGHGLESGALAIMLQSSVRTLLANNETDPVKFFSALNQMVFHNVERMKVGKSLTLVLVDYRDNQLYVSGQHEEVIVVRQGKLELIDTMDLGFPVGLDSDIADFVNQTSVPLNAGDVVVLYTDGITEAENIEGEMYQLERLCQVIQQNWQETAHKIRERVIEDIRQFIGEQKVYDDITLLVLKQK